MNSCSRGWAFGHRWGVNRARTRVLGAVAGLVLLFQLACSTSCKHYLCVNTATLTGSVEAPDELGSVDVGYCSERTCTTGSMDLSTVNQTVCSGDSQGSFDDGVCITLTSQGRLEVEAVLREPDNDKLPADGETYTLTIVDRDSGRVLVDVTRAADYKKTREDDCHLCWRAEMTF